MRCKVCNELLNEYESTRKDPETKQFLDTCTQCLGMSKAYTVNEREEDDNFVKTIKND